MYLGGPANATEFLATYHRQGPLGAQELQLLDGFRRFRWVVQAAYFAWRLSVRDVTGIADEAGNEKGLDDARRGLAELGLDTA
jgi:homoserine kinase type II